MDNQKLALEYMTLAAHQGHVGAMYAMAVIHVEGYEHYHSCTLSEKLFRAVLEKGNSSKVVQKAYYNYLEENFTTAGMYYLEAAFLGYESGLVNAAILLDKYQIFQPKSSLSESFTSNLILMRAGFLLNIDQKAFVYHAFEDLFSLKLDIHQTDIEKVESSLSTQASLRLLESASLEQNSFATVRLADYYYYGKAGLDRNYSKAFYLYLAAQNMNKSNDFQAQAYLSTGYMHQFGIGVPRNLPKARNDYEKASRLGGSLTYISLFAKLLLELEYLFKIDLEMILQKRYYEVAKRILHNLDPFASASILGQLFVFLFGISLLLVLRYRTMNEIRNLLDSSKPSTG